MSVPAFRKTVISVISVALVAACSGENKGTPRPETPPSEAPLTTPVGSSQLLTIPATDELGRFETPVSGLALWQHPEVPFQSLVLAANGAAGLIAINFDQEGVATLPGQFSDGLSLTYLAANGTPVEVVAAFDSSINALRFVRMATDPVAFENWRLSGDVQEIASMRPLCFGRSAEDEALALFGLMPDGNLSRSIIAADDGSLTVEAPVSFQRTDIKTCVSNDYTGDTYFLTDNGTVEVADAFSSDMGFADFVDLPAGEAIELATALQAEGAGYLLAMVSSGPYVIHAYDLSSGEIAGEFTLGEFSDITAVETISAFAADASNFGGLYREGAIAIVEGDSNFALKLASWSAVRNILNLPKTDRLNRRNIGAERTGDDPEELLLQIPDLITEPDIQ
ncbi:hypothetical protein [Parvularcula sp. IMCC14364]|uniref:hypothetical protein n=1 Tax=Parvularcula sp. IMCC14364 TaxID=3067902 RepID=UPI002741613B|nr:hypothetical protein [Parvularcula sp. IMCC14364]